MVDTGVSITRRDILAGVGIASAGIAAPIRGSLAATLDVTPAAIELAIANLATEGLDDVFPVPFEVKHLASSERLRFHVGELVARRLAQPFDSRAVESIETVVMPKRAPLAFGRWALIEPLDAAVYTALAIAAAPAIEARRQPLAAGRVLSYRYAPEKGRLFKAGFTYRTFLRSTHEAIAANSGRLLVAFDIQDFYASIRFAELDAALRRCGVGAACREHLSGLLRYWAGETDRGLPIGSNASRILAEATLIDLDSELESRALNFWRYVDDYRLIVRDRSEAHSILALIAERLAAQGLTLNPAKTKLTAIDSSLSSDARIQLAQRDATRVDDPSTPGSYTQAAPQSFCTLNEGELEGVNLDELYGTITSEIAPDPAIVRLFVLGALDLIVSDSEAGGHVMALPDLITQYPHFAEPVLRAMAERQASTPAEVRDELANRLAELLRERIEPEYAEVAIIQLLGSEGYARPSELEQFLADLTDQQQRDLYSARRTFDQLADCGLPQESSILERWYFAGTPGIRRRTALLMRRKGERPEGKLRARMLFDAETDPFLLEIVDGFI